MPRFLPLTVALATVGTLAACQPNPGTTPSDDSCNAARYLPLVGTPAAEADFSAAKTVRIVAPNTAVTMDHRPDRLNVLTDANGIIQKFTCG